jgi:glycosyltransferase involved in cell wall biosynthesis
MMARICVVTAGHLSTCPRMLKAADALAEAGHRVRVVSARFVDWATAADEDVRRRRAQTWEWAAVDFRRSEAPATYLWSGLRFRSAQALARILGTSRMPQSVSVRAYSRIHPELLRAALAEPADLFYGGTTGGLAAVAEAGRRSGRPYALDLEDFHSAEQDDGPSARLAHALAERLERVILHGAAFLTAGSPGIASAYTEKYGVRPIVVHNTFPLPARAPSLTPNPGEGLKLYWFSQTIGPRRGLEDAVRAMGAAGIAGELHLQGRPVAGCFEQLQRLCDEVAPRLKLVLHAPVAPDELVDVSAEHDAGLALEPGFSLNNRLALSNKAFTYILAGLPVIMTDTPGQRPLATDLGDGAVLYRPGDVAGLARSLKRWSEDRACLARSRAAAWRAARRRWHWEHAEDRGALLSAVTKALERE